MGETPRGTNSSWERATQPARAPLAHHHHPVKTLVSFRGAQSPGLTLEGVDDGEDVEGDEAEHTRGEGEEDECPGDAQQDAQPKEGQDVLELVTFFVLPEDLPDHGPQHD